jgi:hypothetical protein
VRFQLKSKSVEAKSNLETIRIAKTVFFSEFATYVAAEPTPQSGGLPDRALRHRVRAERLLTERFWPDHLLARKGRPRAGGCRHWVPQAGAAPLFAEVGSC